MSIILSTSQMMQLRPKKVINIRKVLHECWWMNDIPDIRLNILILNSSTSQFSALFPTSCYLVPPLTGNASDKSLFPAVRTHNLIAEQKQVPYLMEWIDSVSQSLQRERWMPAY